MTERRFHLGKLLKVRQVETVKAKQALAQAQLAAGQAWVAMESARSRGVAPSAPAEVLHQALTLVAQKRAALAEAERKEQALRRLQDQQVEGQEYDGEAAQ